MKPFNLFLNTRKLTSSREDHLTEFLAAMIMMNEQFNIDFSKLLLGEYAFRHGWETPFISVAETQVSYPGTNCCPDMRLTLSDGHVILCENKIEAPETPGSSTDPRGQLLRYLDLPIDGLIYIRATPSHSLAPQVREHPLFISCDGHHFLWRDIYPLLQSNSHPLLADICKGFEVMGFVPQLPAVGTLSDFNSKTDEQNRMAFKELWAMAADYGLQRGWKVETNKNAELYYSPDETYPAYQVFVSPSKAERFLIRFSLRDEVDPEKLRSRIEAVDVSVPFEVVNYQRAAKRQKIQVSVNVIDVTSSLHNVIGDTEEKNRIQALLFDFVRPFVECADKAFNICQGQDVW